MLSSWFHGKMTREEAEKKLDVTKDGHFLVRESNNFPGDYTLCVRYVVIVGFNFLISFRCTLCFEKLLHVDNRQPATVVIHKYL